MKEMLAGTKGRDWKHQLEKGGVRVCSETEMDGDLPPRPLMADLRLWPVLRAKEDRFEQEFELPVAEFKQNPLWLQHGEQTGAGSSLKRKPTRRKPLPCLPVIPVLPTASVSPALLPHVPILERSYLSAWSPNIPNKEKPFPVHSSWAPKF